MVCSAYILVAVLVAVAGNVVIQVDYNPHPVIITNGQEEYPETKSAEVACDPPDLCKLEVQENRIVIHTVPEVMRDLITISSDCNKSQETLEDAASRPDETPEKLTWKKFKKEARKKNNKKTKKKKTYTTTTEESTTPEDYDVFSNPPSSENTVNTDDYAPDAEETERFDYNENNEETDTHSQEGTERAIEYNGDGSIEEGGESFSKDDGTYSKEGTERTNGYDYYDYKKDGGERYGSKGDDETNNALDVENHPKGDKNENVSALDGKEDNENESNAENGNTSDGDDEFNRNNAKYPSVPESYYGDPIESTTAGGYLSLIPYWN